MKTERKLDWILKKIVDVKHRHDNNTPVHVMDSWTSTEIFHKARALYFKVTIDVHLSSVFRLYEVMFTKVRLQFDAMLGVWGRKVKP